MRLPEARISGSAGAREKRQSQGDLSLSYLKRRRPRPQPWLLASLDASAHAEAHFAGRSSRPEYGAIVLRTMALSFHRRPRASIQSKAKSISCGRTEKNPCASRAVPNT